eukprot:2490891-Pyramimonas_sp.AAC.1
MLAPERERGGGEAKGRRAAGAIRDSSLDFELVVRLYRAQDRNDAFDFNVALADFKSTWVDKGGDQPEAS